MPFGDRFWLDAVAGNGVIPELVRPKSGILCQCIPLGSTDRVKCSASTDRQPLVSTNPSTVSRFGSVGFTSGTVNSTFRSFGPLIVIDARLSPAGTASQSTLTQILSSRATVPRDTLKCSHGSLASAVNVNGALPRLKISK